MCKLRGIRASRADTDHSIIPSAAPLETFFLLFSLFVRRYQLSIFQTASSPAALQPAGGSSHPSPRGGAGLRGARDQDAAPPWSSQHRSARTKVKPNNSLEEINNYNSNHRKVQTLIYVNVFYFISLCFINLNAVNHSQSVIFLQRVGNGTLKMFRTRTSSRK